MRIAPRPWLMLAAMVLAQAATTVVTATPAFLIPHLHATQGMSLAAAGLLAGLPSLGLVFSLVAWGAATDRFGERRVLAIGLLATLLAVALSVLAAASGGEVLLGAAFVVGGALSACTNSASGRLITGWFPPERRGLAMGIRQTCQPLGVAAASLAVPPLAASAGGVPLALAFGGALVLLGLLACLFVVVDPARATRGDSASAAANPYRRSAVLLRIHAASMLLVVPQFALSTFGLVWFTLDFGWSALAAGALVATAQLLGAGGRILVGVWSDLLGSRLRPLRRVAIAAAAAMLATAGCGWLDWSIAAAVAYVIASCISVADNGLAFTAVAELAGPRWAGRALGVQNTGQFLASAAVGPTVGGLIGLLGVPASFALVAIAPALAVRLVPPPRMEHPIVDARGRG